MLVVRITNYGIGSGSRNKGFGFRRHVVIKGGRAQHLKQALTTIRNPSCVPSTLGRNRHLSNVEFMILNMLGAAEHVNGDVASAYVCFVRVKQ